MPTDCFYCLQDSKQLGLLDMFSKSFMEKTTDVVLQNGEDGAQDPVTTDQGWGMCVFSYVCLFM